MSATTPLMSEYPVDVKEGHEGETLPVYHLNEDAEQLTVGQGRRQCFWTRFRHCRGRCERAEGQGPEKKKRSCLKRIIRWFMLTFMVFGIAGFFMAKHKMNCFMKHHPVICVPLDTTGSNSITLPLESFRTHVGIHNSLNGGDIRITHSDDVEEGNVSIKFDVPEDTKLMDEDIPEYYVCHIAGPRMVGLGIHPKDKKAPRVKSTSTTITLSSKESGHSRAINIMGPRPHFGPGHGHGHKHLEKLHNKFGMRGRIHRAIKKAVREAADMAAWTKVEAADAE